MNYVALGRKLAKDLGHSLSILEQSPIGMCLADLNGHLLIINDSFLDIVGYGREELIGKPFKDFTHKNDLARNLENFNALVRGEMNSYTMEKRYISKDGKDVNVLMKVSILMDSEGNRYILAQVIDITEKINLIEVLKHRNIELNSVNRQLDSFIYRASHDLQGPIATLKGLGNIIEKQVGEGELLNGYKETVFKMENINRSLIEFAGVRENNSHHEEVGIEKVLADCLSLVKDHPHFTKAKFNMDVQNDISFNGDVRIVKPIINNMLVNALTFKDPIRDLRIELACREDRDNIFLSISDNGIGMSKEIQERAFDMFFRGSSLSKGSGLGLFMIRQMLDKLHGRVELQSDEGLGTQVNVWIPKKTDPALISGI